MKELSRRGFLSGAALGAASLAGAGLFGCSSKPESGSSNGTSGSAIVWGAETEVVVCGAGGTGLAAACAAAKAGAKVICYEIQSGPGGTSALSGGVMQAAGTKWQKEYTTFKTDTPAVHAACYIKQAEGIANEELVKLICDAAPGDLEWLESLGVKWDHVYGNTHVPYCDPENLHADRIHAYEGGGAGGGGKIYTDIEYAEAQKLGVTFEFNCEVKSLIYDKAKGVLGVVVKKPVPIST
jgi:urocanate reductase